MYFISGVSGVGKSTLIPLLKKLLGTERFDVREFDERGVPDGGGQEWHDKETRYWLDVGIENAKKGKSTIVCGFSLPEIVRRVSQKGDLPVQVFLLDAPVDTIRARLIGRYPNLQSKEEIRRASGMPLDEFVEKMAADSAAVRAICEKEGCPIIDTEDKTPEDVAKEIVANLQQ